MRGVVRGAMLGAVSVIAMTAAGDESPPPEDWPTAEFHFARMYYSDAGYGAYGRGFRGGSWTVDYPEAEYHFSMGVSRLTRVNMDGEARMLRVTDDTIFDYPWLYAVEVGRWYLDDMEAARLREYLLRGGFLMVDDFHGTLQWNGFWDSMQRVFPDRAWVEISEDDPSCTCSTT